MKNDLRSEQPGDEAQIHAIHRRAFQGQEAQLVDLLRERGKNIVSIVAQKDGLLIGHVLFTEAIAEPMNQFRGVGLAPVAVLPEFQNQGIGSSLVRAGLEACVQKGYDYVVVLGHTDYYPRFGFRKASAFGLGNTYDVDEPFMALAFRPGVLGNFSGIIKYQPEFSELDV